MNTTRRQFLAGVSAAAVAPALPAIASAAEVTISGNLNPLYGTGPITLALKDCITWNEYTAIKLKQMDDKLRQKTMEETLISHHMR